jgi:glycerol kinase
MADYILCLDVGTTNIKGILFDRNGEIVAQARRRPNYIMEVPGQVEQDPKEIWEMSKQVIEEVINSKNLKAENIDSIGITTQRGSFCLWDKNSGQVHSNIITWQDKRCAAYVEKKNKSFFMKIIRGLTKIIYIFTRNTKMLTASMLYYTTDHATARTGFLLKNNPELAKKIQSPDTSIVWGTIDTWILWNLTQGEIHATDYSNVSSTGLLDPFSLKWNPLPLGAFNIPKHILPEIRPTSGDFGLTKLFGGGEIPIRSIMADQQASLYGQGCLNKGEIKVTNGTGSFVDINTADAPYASKRKLYPLIAWYIEKEVEEIDEEGKTIKKIVGVPTYLLEGVSHNTGNIVDWIQQELNLYNKPEETEKMASSVESTNGVYFLPTFTSGISFPYWDPTARGCLFGVSLETKKEHIVRAVLEGICFRIKDIVDGIIRDTKINVEKIKADGGVSRNEFVLQFLSDILGLEIEHSSNLETTALGAIFMAGLASGFWKDENDLLQIRKVDKTYKPRISKDERDKKYSNWKNIITRSLNYDID